MNRSHLNHTYPNDVTVSIQNKIFLLNSLIVLSHDIYQFDCLGSSNFVILDYIIQTVFRSFQVPRYLELTFLFASVASYVS